MSQKDENERLFKHHKEQEMLIESHPKYKNHPRYKRFTLSNVVRNDCAIYKDNLSFTIFYDDYLLRGHTFHFITPAEFSIGWRHYSASLTSTEIENLYKQLKQIKCPYVKSRIEKNKCYECMEFNLNRYEKCSKILNEEVLNEYIWAVSCVLKNVLEKPRFSKTIQDRAGRRAKMLIGLCDQGIVVKCELMDDNITYNVVTAYVPDAEKHGNIFYDKKLYLFYTIATVKREIEERHMKGKPLLCNDKNWWPWGM